MQSPTIPLAGRYRCVATVPLPEDACWWIALDGDSGEHVAAAVVDARELARCVARRGEKHAHLAAIVDVVARPEPEAVPGGHVPPGAGVAIAELVPGQTLHGQLVRGRIHPFKAVAWVLRLADAVQRLHERSAPHGAISPYTIVVEPMGRAISPVLASLTAPAIAAGASPDRLAGAGPSAEDDVWALHAVLYTALTGSVPFEGGSAAALRQRIQAGPPRSLADHGLNEPILQQILERGLHAEERHRVSELAALSSALDAWERGREPEAPRPRPPRAARPAPVTVPDRLAFDLSALSSGEAVPAPPLGAPDSTVTASAKPGPSPASPVASAVAVPAPPAPRPPPRRRRVWPWLLGGAMLLGAAAGGVVVAGRLGGPEPEPVAAPPPPRASPSVSSSASAKPELTPKEKVLTCVRSYLEQATLEGVSDVDFLCGSDPFPEVATRLFALTVPPAPPATSAGRPSTAPSSEGIVITGESNPYDLGWYEIPASVIVRTTCCPNAAPVTLPTTPGWCEQLQGQMRLLAEASRKPIELSPYARRYEDAVQCLFSTATAHGYRYPQVPSELQRYNFQRFLKDAAESDAKRARMRWLR